MSKTTIHKIGETVIFPKTFFCPFSAKNVELVKVYSFSKKAFDNCEDWGSPEAQCFKIADFNMEINAFDIRLFYGEPVDFGYLKDNPEKLHFLPVGMLPPYEKGFVRIGVFNLEQYYRIPITMWEFGLYIDAFLFNVKAQQAALQKEHSENQARRRLKLITYLKEGDDLPF